MTKQEIKEELINVTHKYGFRIIAIDKAPSGVNGLLSILNKDNYYVFVKCEKEIKDIGTEKQKKLIVRFSIQYDSYHNENGIAFVYATGGNSARIVKNKEDVEEIFRNSLWCHNLYSYEELDMLKNKNSTITPFDFIKQG